MANGSTSPPRRSGRASGSAWSQTRTPRPPDALSAYPRAHEAAHIARDHVARCRTRALMLASIDGVVMDAADATISVSDEGLLRGDGVFEVIRVYRGVPFALTEHLQRMSRSAASLRLPFDEDA